MDGRALIFFFNSPEVFFNLNASFTCSTHLERRFVHLKFCSPAIRAKVFVPMGGSEKLPARDAKLFLPFVMT